MLPLILVFAAWAERPASVGFVDSASGRIRCHYAEDEHAPLCADVAAYAEVAWATQVGQLGFRQPVPDDGVGGSDALDIYLTKAAGGAGSAWVDCENGDPGCIDADPTDAVAGTPSYVVIDPRTEDLEHFTYHEFNHTLQYATDYWEPFLCAWEGTAVAAERWTDPAWPTSESDLADYQATPWTSAVLQDGYFLDEEYDLWTWYEYGAVAWVYFLDDHYGDGAGAIGPELWEAMAQPGETGEPDVLDAWDAISLDWRASMVAFAAERARFGTEAAPEYAAFAGEAAWALRDASDLVAPTARTPRYPPYPLGTSYFDVAVTAGQDLRISLDGDPSVDWAVVVVDADGESVGGDEVDYVAARDGTITIAVVNLGPPGMDAEDPLETATFTLHLRPALANDEDTTADCGCRHGAMGVGWGALATLLVFRRSRR